VQNRWLPSVIVTAVLCAVIIPSSWRIAAKAGYPRWIALLTIVSPLNLVLLAIFAFREWPIERRLRAALASSGLHGDCGEAQ
jgi:hypothetical protein